MSADEWDITQCRQAQRDAWMATEKDGPPTFEAGLRRCIHDCNYEREDNRLSRDRAKLQWNEGKGIHRCLESSNAKGTPP